MTTLGAEIVCIGPGSVEIGMPFNPGHTQQDGFVHAGVITSILDSACGYAAYSVAPEGCNVLTVEFKVSLPAPGGGEKVRGQGASQAPWKDTHNMRRRRVRNQRGRREIDRDHARHHHESSKSCTNLFRVAKHVAGAKRSLKEPSLTNRKHFDLDTAPKTQLANTQCAPGSR